MLLTMEQSKYLDLNKNNQYSDDQYADYKDKYIFNDKGKATDKEKILAIQLNEDYYEVFGYNIIANISELKKQITIK